VAFIEFELYGTVINFSCFSGAVGQAKSPAAAAPHRGGHVEALQQPAPQHQVPQTALPDEGGGPPLPPPLRLRRAVQGHHAGAEPHAQPEDVGDDRGGG
jgi:hypothetical protein